MAVMVSVLPGGLGLGSLRMYPNVLTQVWITLMTLQGRGVDSFLASKVWHLSSVIYSESSCLSEATLQESALDVMFSTDDNLKDSARARQSLFLHVLASLASCPCRASTASTHSLMSSLGPKLGSVLFFRAVVLVWPCKQNGLGRRGRM